MTLILTLIQFQIKASAVDYSDKSTEQVKLMHDTKVYPLRVKMIVVSGGCRTS